VDASDVDVIFVFNDIGDTDWVPIGIEDRPYLILDCEPDTTGRLDTDKFTTLYDGNKL